MSVSKTDWTKQKAVVQQNNIDEFNDKYGKAFAEPTFKDAFLESWVLRGDMSDSTALAALCTFAAEHKYLTEKENAIYIKIPFDHFLQFTDVCDKLNPNQALE